MAGMPALFGPQAGLYLWRACPRGADVPLSLGDQPSEHPADLCFRYFDVGCRVQRLQRDWPSFYGEMFSTRVRLSGLAIGTQIGFAIGGFAPVVAAAVQREGPNAWVPVALLNAAICVVASIAAWTARETYNIPMHDLGSQTAATALSAARSRSAHSG